MKAREIAARLGSSPVARPDHLQRQQALVPPTSDDAFADALKQARGAQQQAPPRVKLSAHAEQRMAQRDISLTRPERQELSHALDKLNEKGSRDALLLRADAAFVVNVPNRTIVTAMNQSDLQERIFTQIDSAMLV